MEKLFLAEPSKAYEESFKEYALAYKEANETYYFEKYGKALDNFDEYINNQIKLSKGINIPEGYVTTSTFWLICNQAVVGVVRVRHEELESAGHIGYDIAPCYRKKGYGTEILKLAIEKAKLIGIAEPIVTCNTNNEASRKIIEKNNGKFLGQIFDEEENEYLFKFKILSRYSNNI
ncbi:GNAT family N-acetyltransferase [Clostridium manihotivorum]|uniref:GNAT family N-acetyltransferase n=1 Tax=Clostridium manihotivorum TaxID=2320868 RepID=A0A410DXM0_9CLOT|nr:GNAT family N-acetyltransferase [Clostridium manihotivorum]QAA33781.1 GNAT family N-acetyltransferase [Clostridium manihotivorum]